MYVITIDGEVKYSTHDWHELMQEYRKRRKETDKPVLLSKVEPESEVS